jgi:hypothetical protein
MAVGIRHPDHVAPSIRKKLILTSSTSGGRSVGTVPSRTQAMEFFINVVLTFSWDDWACFWNGSIWIRGRIFVSARIRADSNFKRSLCFVLMDVIRWFRLPFKISSRTSGWRPPIVHNGSVHFSKWMLDWCKWNVHVTRIQALLWIIPWILKEGTFWLTELSAVATAIVQ